MRTPRSSYAAVAAGALLIAALASCSQDRIGGPSPDGRPTGYTVPVADIDDSITVLVTTEPHRNLSLNTWDFIQRHYAAGNEVNVTEGIEKLRQTLVERYNAGAITSMPRIVGLMEAVLAAVGRDDSYGVIYEGDLTVTPGEEDVQITFKNMPEGYGALVVEIVRQPDGTQVPGVGARTQVSPVHSINTVPFVPGGFEGGFIVVVCTEEAYASTPGLRVGKQSGENFYVGRPVPGYDPPEDVCTEEEQTFSSAKGFTGKALALVRNLVTVRKAYAAHGGLAGEFHDDDLDPTNGEFTGLSDFVGFQYKQETSLALSVPAEVIYPGTVTATATLTTESGPLAGKSVSLTIEKTEPTFTAAWSSTTSMVTDALGVATWTWLNGQLPLGKHDLDAAFVEDDDYLGSTASGNTWYRYNYSVGHVFLSPILIYPQRSYFASNIPVKFELYQANGTTKIGTAKSTLAVYAGTFSNLDDPATWGTPVFGPVSNPFKFGGGQYTYNLSVRSLPTTTTDYTIVVTLDDGSRMFGAVGVK